MILSCQNICKAFGEKVILNDASFHIEDREKAALIGCNGAGKTTLLRIIMQELSADSGTVVLARDKNIGYLAQYQDIHGHHTIYEELLTTKQHIIDMERRIRNMEQEMNTVTGDELNRLMETYTRLTHQFELENGYAYKSELTGVLKGLGFTEEDYDKQIETLSGGQKTRVALGKMLLSKPDILLLDELIVFPDLDVHFYGLRRRASVRDEHFCLHIGLLFRHFILNQIDTRRSIVGERDINQVRYDQIHIPVNSSIEIKIAD